MSHIRNCNSQRPSEVAGRCLLTAIKHKEEEIDGDSNEEEEEAEDDEEEEGGGNQLQLVNGN